MEGRKLLVGPLLHQTHHKLKVILRDDRHDDLLLLLALGPRRSVQTGRTSCAVGRRAFTPRQPVVLLQPLVVVLVERVVKTEARWTRARLLDRVREPNVRRRVLPLVARVEQVAVGDDSGRVRCWNVVELLLDRCWRLEICC